MGDYGKGVKRVFDQYRSLGMKQVTMKLYEGSRHEILNDLEREQVCRDLGDWICSLCS